MQTSRDSALSTSTIASSSASSYVTSRVDLPAETSLIQGQDQKDELAHLTRLAKGQLKEEIFNMRESVKKDLEGLVKRQALAADRVERAARNLAMRALELDTRALEIERDEAIVKERVSRVEEREQKVETVLKNVGEREGVMAAREAGVKYSAVEQKTLYEWARHLEEREKKVGDAETRERERIAERLAAVTRRELLVEERERRMEAVLRERETTLERRTTAAKELLESVERRRAEALLKIEMERSHFWTHQQRLSAVVANETEALLEEQVALRTQFEGEAARARRQLKEMSDAVARMSVRIDDAARLGGIGRREDRQGAPLEDVALLNGIGSLALGNGGCLARDTNPGREDAKSP